MEGERGWKVGKIKEDKTIRYYRWVSVLLGKKGDTKSDLCIGTECDLAQTRKCDLAQTQILAGNMDFVARQGPPYISNSTILPHSLSYHLPLTI